jgi:phosphonate transport system substrate-binding protein
MVSHTPRKTLRMTSLMSGNADSFFRSMGRYLADRFQVPYEVVDDIPWQERERLLDGGVIDVAWICGLPYIERAGKAAPAIELLAAPVMGGERYKNLPIYFSDVVVHRDSPVRAFAELRGASWAYNERHSHSGYNVLRYHLAALGETGHYFGRVLESGSHLKSLDMVLNHQVDAAAIDSTVLETEIRLNPELRSKVRIIDSLGPSPIPPWVVSRSLSREIVLRLQSTLLQMHEDPIGLKLLSEAQIARFTGVSDGDYDAIRHMAAKASSVEL